MVKLLQSAPLKERFGAQGLEAHGSTPGEFAACVKAGLAKWSGVVRTAGLQVQ